MRKLSVAMVAMAIAGCGGLAHEGGADAGTAANLSNTDEIAQGAADLMASFDDSGSGGEFSSRIPLYRPGFDRTNLDRALDLLMPPAYGASCLSVTYDACSAGVMTKDFANCNILRNTFSGNVTLTFSQSTCSFGATGDTISRAANYTISGATGATFTVSTQGSGQKVAKTADGYTFSVPGMERVAKDSTGKAIFDVTTKTTQDIVFQGVGRVARAITSGTIQISDSVTGNVATLTAKNVAWLATCICPVSGSLSGTLTDAAAGSHTYQLQFSGCGSGIVTVDGTSADVTFDSCWSL